ncbi:MAG TPA: DUF488 domain-containing protein [Gemmatimonadales bacterium]|nr:DUF488 domain-containing protein [Gemmatimonadales bacterium]
MDPTVWTVGHSTRPLEGLLDLLARHRIEAVADVRRSPASRRLPHFGRDRLEPALRARAIEYVWFPSLGGRRSPRPDSTNTAWRNAAFRGYADHMETEEFAEGLTGLLHLAYAHPTALLCAEAVWWRCHRALIADVLRWLGFEVVHILDAGSSVLHPYSTAARIRRGRLSYADGGGS